MDIMDVLEAVKTKQPKFKVIESGAVKILKFNAYKMIVFCSRQNIFLKTENNHLIDTFSNIDEFINYLATNDWMLAFRENNDSQLWMALDKLADHLINITPSTARPRS